jgi:hypothetical protein
MQKVMVIHAKDLALKLGCAQGYESKFLKRNLYMLLATY